MALIFELVINAGPDRAAAEQVAEQLADLPPLPAGRHRVSLVPPQIRAVQGEDGAEYQEVSVAAAGVGHERGECQIFGVPDLGGQFVLDGASTRAAQTETLGRTPIV